MKKVQALRKLALMLEPNGTVKVVSSTKLYVGGFGFIGLAVYVPVTQHREGGTNPLLTVHTSAIDPFGKFGSKGKYALPYIGEYEIDGARYMLFERPMPKAFLEKEGELKLIVNYCEVDEENNIVARLTSDAITLKVEAGGIADGEAASETDVTLAALNEVTAKMEQLEDSVGTLLQQPDCTDADNVATQENPLKVEISETGKLKFSNIKGKKGDAATIKVGDVTTLSPNQNATVSNGGTVNDAKLNFGIPQGVKGDKGDAATITVGEVESISYDKSATVANSGSVNDAVLDFKLPQGKPAEITIGKTTTLSPESSAHVDNVGTKNAPILDFAIPQGKAAEFSVGVTRTLPPESVARVENVGTKNAPILDFYIPKGDGFRISKTYASIEAMNAEFESDGVPLYGFVIIETGNVNDEDNARLYYKGEERYEYLTDLSGAQGFKGDTGATPSLTASVSLAEEDSRVPSAEVQVKKSGEQSPEAPLLDLTLKNIVPKINVETKAGTNDVEGSLSIDSTIERVDDTNDYNLTFTFNNIVGGLTKQALGLDNVDNTADVDKPVSTAMQEKLNEVKADATNALTAASTATQEKLDEVKADVANAQTTANNALPKSGGTMTGSLSVDNLRTGTLTANTLKAENINNAWGRPILKTYQLTSDGDCLYVGSGSQTVITAGESVIPLKTVANGTEEQLYLESNYDVYVYSNTQNGIDSAKVWTFGTDGKLTTPGSIWVSTNGEIAVTRGFPYVGGVGVYGTVIAQDGIAMRNPNGASDAGWMRITGTTEETTVLEIAVGDDCDGGEVIVARQYNASGTYRQMSLLDVNGDTVAARNFITTNGQIIENGARVYSPNNKPSPSDIGALPTSGGTISGSLNVTGTLSEKGNRVYSKANPPYNNVLTYTSGTACRTALANGSVGVGMRIDYNYTHFLIGSGEVGGITSYQEINESGSGFVTEVTSSSITYMNYSGTRKTISVPNKSGSGLLNKDTYFSGSFNFYY